ncbi:MAG: energy transducer TonB [Muribaculaceae bacterium]|nr:energy transducer TonB [Muribaculaceae bacterium]
MLLLRPSNLIPTILRRSAALAGAAFILLSLSSVAGAQTCRVSLGTTSSGHCAYMEVYEYDYVHDKPCYPGGDCQLMEFINSTRRYPEKAYKNGVQGRVTCSFVVNANGAISHIKVLKSVEESLNREAVRILSLMPSWIPGKVDGRPVPVRVIRSIPFRR